MEAVRTNINPPNTSIINTYKSLFVRTMIDYYEKICDRDNIRSTMLYYCIEALACCNNIRREVCIKWA